MGIAFRIDLATGLIAAVVDGTVTGDDFHDFAQRLGTDPNWNAATRSITDARSAVTQAVTPEMLAAFAALYAEMRRGHHPLTSAVVASRDFELASTFSEIPSGDGSRTIAFNSVETACTWLGVDPSWVNAIITELRDELRGSPAEPG